MLGLVYYVLCVGSLYCKIYVAFHLLLLYSDVLNSYIFACVSCTVVSPVETLGAQFASHK